MRVTLNGDDVRAFVTSDPVENELDPVDKEFMEALEARLRREERLWWLEWREDQIDLAAIRDCADEPTIPWSEVRKELELE